MAETRKYTVVDLFAGVGGLSYGFSRNDRFEIILANEMQKDNRFLRRKEICDTEFFEIATRIYNELLGFAARKYEILDIGE